MPKFVIERSLPGAGAMTDEQWAGIAQTSCGVIRQLGPDLQWIHSYVTPDKVYCIYLSPDEETLREHARRGGFPADRISRVDRIADPATAELVRAVR
jgi:hypothetical protein